MINRYYIYKYCFLFCLDNLIQPLDISTIIKDATQHNWLLELKTLNLIKILFIFYSKWINRLFNLDEHEYDLIFNFVSFYK